MLAQTAADPEGLRGIRILRPVPLIPYLRLQGIDDIAPSHQVNEAPLQVVGQILILHLRVQADDVHARLPQVAQDQLQQIGLALAGVAKDQDGTVGLVLRPLVEVHQDIAAELVTAHIEAMGIRLSAVVEGIEIGHAAGRQHPLELVPEHIFPAGHHGLEALLLPEHQSIHVQLGADQLSQHLRL